MFCRRIFPPSPRQPVTPITATCCDHSEVTHISGDPFRHFFFSFPRSAAAMRCKWLRGALDRPECNQISANLMQQHRQRAHVVGQLLALVAQGRYFGLRIRGGDGQSTDFGIGISQCHHCLVGAGLPIEAYSCRPARSVVSDDHVFIVKAGDPAFAWHAEDPGGAIPDRDLVFLAGPGAGRRGSRDVGIASCWRSGRRCPGIADRWGRTARPPRGSSTKSTSPSRSRRCGDELLRSCFGTGRISKWPQSDREHSFNILPMV